MMAAMPLYQVILKVGDHAAFMTVEGRSLGAAGDYYRIETDPVPSFFAREHTIGIVLADGIKKNASTVSDPNPKQGNA
jgi:hypothetical protein